ncbi:MAG: DegT/DnrJ/EryC1/StrS family aminotransferase [Deltaproteobacteria bacterium]|nr:MAG: DegT/DnrJ/EryC1/StrS family aminotransferase [Deltaproteobacteria bacterium]
MALGRIPRFSPSFSPREALVAARYLLRDGPDTEMVERFEREFRSYIGASHAVMVPSARYGLYLLLEAMGIGEGDEVIVPALTYFAVPAMIPLLGARPVFADIGLTTHVLDPEAFEAAITPRTRAVVPTHLFGTPCDMDAIRDIARRHDIRVIEDCAQSTGARYRNVRVGNLGDAAYYTFGLTKNMTTLSGAMITTDAAAVAARIRGIIRAGGLTDKKKLAREALTGLAMFVATHPAVYWATVHPAVVVGNALGQDPIHDRFGEAEVRYDRLPAHYRSASQARGAQAAVGLRQLARLEQLNGARIRNGRRLDAGLAHVPGLTVPSYPDGAEPIYMSFVVHHPRRDALAAALRRRGVDTTVGYMSDLSSHPLFAEFAADCPNARRAFRELLHLPVHPNLRPRDLDHMIEATRRACLEIGA